jgi:N-acetylglutamate synthase-like GNAT family acetyltransferase
MTLKTLHIADKRFTSEEMTIAAFTQEDLEAEAALIFSLFQEREKFFGFNPGVVIEYPKIDPPEDSPFLADPVRYIAARCNAAAGGTPIGRVVILNTYADRLYAPLVEAGYRLSRIEMPAGPDNTGAFTCDLSDHPQEDRTLYLEAVNEADEKIRPKFVLKLSDAAGHLKGGACGSIHDRAGQRYAYLATLVVAPNQPPTTGTCLAQEMLHFLARMGVDTVHLGTQTAGPFYEKLGFSITHHLIPGLRHRLGKNGRITLHDLVMMAMDIPTE